MRTIVAVGSAFVLVVAGCRGGQSERAQTADVTVQEEAGSILSDPVQYEARGVVKSITPSRTYVNIEHGNISGFMDAMTMLFPVQDSTVLQHVAADDSIRFVLTVDGNVFVTEVEVIE